ncbi:hypothetical protein BCR39DRAFT_544677 [Naematelia encephala]|uniref:Uncharacterized protein n=1 Tax=Naematelia encephala TaxID=71784 RepID=A0A1Y2ARR9_9TREE|nr:hypothetical protein BCR39DRAFT_544677 [Naematelia encephala]
MTELSNSTIPGSTDPQYSYKRRRRRHDLKSPRSFHSSHSHDTPIAFYFILFVVLSLVTLAAAAPNNCLRFADYDSINQLFIDGGPGTKVFLCPSKVYRLSGTVVFTAADQELATYGYPSGAERATLRVEGKFATAVQGDCRRCVRVGVRALIIDGNRNVLGRLQDVEEATGLVVLGGNEGQSVRGCWLRDPRGFTAIHVREGDKLSCSGAIIEKNEIGPAGEEYDPEVDGPDPEAAPKGRPLADGISIACRDSYVRDNSFHDCTDAAVVVYCAPGTVVHANTITARTRSSMAGILAVDSTPFDGDYTGTMIKANIIDAARRIIRVGIGLGATVWSDDTETILKGGSVVANGIRGRHMGYGIAAAGLEGWTVTDNWDEATHEGRSSPRCFDDPINPHPTAFLFHSESIKDSTFQPGFLDQEFQYVVCIDGVEGTHHNPPPAAHEDSAPPAPDAPPVAPQPPVPTEGFNTGSEILDDILLHSQQRMLEALEHLSRRFDIMANEAGTGMVEGARVGPIVANALADLTDRVAGLEARQAALIKIASEMRSAMKLWDGEMSALNEWQYEMLLDVQHRLGIHLATPDESSSSSSLKKSGHTEIHLESSHGASTSTVTWETVGRWIVGQGIFALGVWGFRRWSARRRHGKLS